MATTDPKVMNLVERMLKKNPAAAVADMYEKALQTNPSVAELTHRQFHARYPLQLKRGRVGSLVMPKSGAATKPAKKPAKKPTGAKRGRPRKAAPAAAAPPAPKKRARRGRPRKRAAQPVAAAPAAAASSGVNRDVVRDQFLRFAAELAAADDRKSVVRVLSGIEKYVDRVAAGS